eukprot:Anaeramoba_ignava/a607562_60.p1 GENE.a607562_60~~a607562_60.p1  ORF type:complete len:729 (-),score=222.59 a607562_60:188-2374(-)
MQYIEEIKNEPEPEQQLQALRRIKNYVIGNKIHKKQMMENGIVKILVEIIKKNEDERRVTEAATILGSFACSTTRAEVEGLIKERADIGLWELVLKSKNEKVQESALRSLKIMYQSAEPPEHNVYSEENAAVVETLIKMLSSERIKTRELAAFLVARSCRTDSQKAVFISKGGVNGLLSILNERAISASKSHEAALDALASLLHENADCARIVAAKTPHIVAMAFSFMKDSSNVFKLISSKILTSLLKADSISNEKDRAKVETRLLPILVKLLDDSDVVLRSEVPRAIAAFSQHSDKARKDIAESNAIDKLVKIFSDMLSKPDEFVEIPQDTPPVLTNTGAQIISSFLFSVQIFSENSDDLRRKISDAKILLKIAPFLRANIPDIALNTAKIIRNLTRSTKQFDPALSDDFLLDLLFAVFRQSHSNTKEIICIIFCNMSLLSLDFKNKLFEKDLLQDLSSLIDSPVAELRLNAFWALKNMLYRASSQIKQKFLAQIPFKKLFSFLSSSETQIREQVFGILRNFASGKVDDVQMILPVQEDLVVFIEKELIFFMDSTLNTNSQEKSNEMKIEIPNENSNQISNENSIQISNENSNQIQTDSKMILEKEKTLKTANPQNHKNLALNTIYLISNLSTGNEQQKILLLKKNIIDTLNKLLFFPDDEIQKGVIWCFINLSWNCPDQEMTKKRINELKSFGIVPNLQKIVSSHKKTEIQDLAKKAINKIEIKLK